MEVVVKFHWNRMCSFWEEIASICGWTDGRTTCHPISSLELLYRWAKNHPREYYNKRTTVGSCPGLSDDPEESPRHKTLRTENFTAWSMNRDFLLKWRWILWAHPGETPFHILKPTYVDTNQRHTHKHTHTHTHVIDMFHLSTPTHHTCVITDCSTYCTQPRNLE